MRRLRKDHDTLTIQYICILTARCTQPNASYSWLEPAKSAVQTPTPTLGGCAEPATRKSALAPQRPPPAELGGNATTPSTRVKVPSSCRVLSHNRRSQVQSRSNGRRDTNGRALNSRVRKWGLHPAQRQPGVKSAVSGRLRHRLCRLTRRHGHPWSRRPSRRILAATAVRACNPSGRGVSASHAAIRCTPLICSQRSPRWEGTTDRVRRQSGAPPGHH